MRRRPFPGHPPDRFLAHAHSRFFRIGIPNVLARGVRRTIPKYPDEVCTGTVMADHGRYTLKKGYKTVSSN
ncbi:hypothetical protein JTE90_025871 [Oedothorax gibbosus]|uniref:Uncharacterized protein n=1 Tax=Oedothorax gibbosus TaxID=931172 RepID=A0AAV6UN92_9ARAC|nr:hypothetical protein JTE90_025871 [Oedothorax gibbosus]